MTVLDSIPIPILLFLLVIFVSFAAFFSAGETSLMAINRYRSRHLAKTNSTAARIKKLLNHPDRILSTLLLGNNFLNIVCSSIATIVGLRWMGDLGVLIATIMITIVILIFAEIAPKTLAAIKPDAIAYAIIRPLEISLWILYPLVWICNQITYGLLWMIGIRKISSVHLKKRDALNREELKSMISDSPHQITEHAQNMLLSILELEKITLEDIMVPCSDIVGIDLGLPNRSDFEAQFQNLSHTMLPVYDHRLNNIQGILHIRDLNLLTQNPEKLTPERILKIMRQPYFVPQKTTAYAQLLKFRDRQERLGCVVNEYGELIGLITIEDILAEITGDMNLNDYTQDQLITLQPDGTYLVDASLNVREVNRKLSMQLPTESAKTLSGLIIETLETIPNPGTCLKIQNIPIEIIKIQDNVVKIARLGISKTPDIPRQYLI